MYVGFVQTYFTAFSLVMYTWPWGGGGSGQVLMTGRITNDIPGWRRLTCRGEGMDSCIVVGVSMVVDGSVVAGVGVVTGVRHFRPSSSKRAVCATEILWHIYHQSISMLYIG